MRRHPPDILITTPESLYLILTSAAREMLAAVETVIVDEIHAMAGTKRGTHLALSLERLEHLAGRDVQRVGLSATQRPLEEIARFLGGARPRGRDRRRRRGQAARPRGDRPGRGHARAGRRRRRRRRAAPVDLAGALPAPARAGPGAPLDARLREQPPLGRAGRPPPERARREPTSPAPTTARSPASSGSRSRTCSSPGSCRRSSPPRRSSSGSTWARSTWSSRSSRRSRSPPACSGWAGPATRWTTPRSAASCPSTAATCSRRRSSSTACAAARSSTPACPRQPLDVLAQQLVAATALDDWTVDDLYELATRAHPYRDLSRAQFEGVLDMLAGRYPSDEFAELRPRVVWDRTAGVVRARPDARRLAVTSGGTIPDRGLYGVFLAESGARVGELDEEMVYEARQGEVFQLGASLVADRADHPRPGAGLARAGRARADAVLEGRRRRPPVRARPGRRRGDAHAPLPGRPRRRAPPATCTPTWTTRRRTPASSRPTARSSSSASATRSATGACACSRRSAAACTRRGRSPWRRGWRARSASRSRRCGPTTASLCGCPTRTRRRPST